MKYPLTPGGRAQTDSRRNFLKWLAAGSAWAACFTARSAFSADSASPTSGKKFVVGHRGACAYAPENTLESYRLALDQGVDYVEQDLQITKDGVLVCCHDTSLERISNVREVFPDRFVEEPGKSGTVKRWPFHQFTLKEIKRLDAGSWFDARFKGTAIPTWQEAIDLIKGKAGLCPETKAPEFYGRYGFKMETLVADLLKKNGLDRPGTARGTPVLLQSFSAESLKRLRSEHGLAHPSLQLMEARVKWSAAQLRQIKPYATGIGPDKKDATPALVEAAHAAGLEVIPYTFRARDVVGYKDVADEMRHYLYEVSVDGLFTDNPDKFPRKG